MRTVILAIFSSLIISCTNDRTESMNILFLHHSTGNVIWKGNQSVLQKLLSRASTRVSDFVSPALLPDRIKKYNKKFSKDYRITEMVFPKVTPYGWKNYPYDYYNIWVKNAGDKPFMEEPTLEMLTREYDVIIFKHCFPVCNIGPDRDTADINSENKTIANYKLQYLALKEKLHSFSKNKFILLTGAAQVEAAIKQDEAARAREFFEWVKQDWDESSDNIFIWDLYEIQTEGGLYFKEDYAAATNDSHPNGMFAEKAGDLLFQRLIDVIENSGERTRLTGAK